MCGYFYRPPTASAAPMDVDEDSKADPAAMDKDNDPQGSAASHDAQSVSKFLLQAARGIGVNC